MPSVLSRRRSRTRALGAAAVGVVAAGLLVAPSVPGAAAADPEPTYPSAEPSTGSLVDGTVGEFVDGRYIVVLRAPAAASYDGSNRRFAATRSPGGQFRADTAAVRTYTSHLRTTHRDLAGEVGATAAKSYTVASNGFAAMLTKEQAFELSSDKRVLMVAPDEQRSKDTVNTPQFLGLSGKGGVWQQRGGAQSAGDGIVVADLDSGIWPESGSFRGKEIGLGPVGPWDITMSRTGATRMEKIDGTTFTGQCQTGERWTLSDCNSKIIGARYYPDTFQDTVPEGEVSPTEFISTRDGDGHGSHTASTAAGNIKKNVTTEGREFGKVSGMAPAAKLAVYKVCWEDTDPATGGCYNSAILSAIDDAVSDGADVLNFSISGSLDTVLDPVELAFEGAAEAGLFIAASAGNSGPTPSTVAHNSPWLTTVASSTHVNYENTIVLGNGIKVVGASITTKKIAPTRIVLAEDAVVAGGDAEDASLCGPDTLDPVKVSGKIAVCYRGVYDRVAKSAEVKRAGGKALIMINPSENSLDADFHEVPTIHVSDVQGRKVLRYVANKGAAATASFVLGNQTKQVTELPQISGFSSRGPALANDGDLLKPDIAAPGSSVLAAVAPPSNSGRGYDLYSGTSMSAPHVAGLAAFMLGERPRWSPMDVKSAMMTSSTPLEDASGKRSTDVFAGGAGQVRPTAFFDPGLFVTADATDWRGFITGQGLDTGVPAVEAKDLNVPSMAQSAVTGSTSFVREFRATRKGTWSINASVPGFRVTTNRAKVISSRANDLIRVRFTFTRTTAPLDAYAKGAITLSGPTAVRLPVALRPVAVDVPESVSGEGVDGSVEVPVLAGFTGDLDVTAEGLTKAESVSSSVPQGDYELQCFTVAPGTTSAVFDLDAADDTSDLDLFVYSGTACSEAGVTGLVGQAATGSADEKLVVSDPEPGLYIVQVDGFSAGEQGDPIDYALDFFGVGATPGEGDLTVTPDPVPVTSNQETSFEVSWTGLDAGARYLGELSYDGSDDTTLVEVDTGSATPPVRPQG